MLFSVLAFLLPGMGSRAEAQPAITINANIYYRLTTTLQSKEMSMDIVPDGLSNNIPALAGASNYAGQYWKLTPAAGGSFRMTTHWRGADMAMDFSDSTQETKGVLLAPKGHHSGATWKVTPDGNGSFRVGVTVKGVEYVLDAMVGGHTHGYLVLVAKKSRPGASWKLVPLTAGNPAPPPCPAPFLELRGQHVKLQAYNGPQNNYLRHFAFLGFLNPIVTPQEVSDSTFKIVPGLGGSGVSFESINFPNMFLRHFLFRLTLSLQTPDDLFRNDATFQVVPGLADPRWISLRSLNYPARYLRHRGAEFWLDEQGADDQYRQDATFRIVVVK